MPCRGAELGLLSAFRAAPLASFCGMRGYLTIALGNKKHRHFHVYVVCLMNILLCYRLIISIIKDRYSIDRLLAL